MFRECVGQDIAFEVRTSLSTNKCQLSQGASPRPPSRHYLCIASTLYNCSCYVNTKPSHLPAYHRSATPVQSLCAPSLLCALILTQRSSSTEPPQAPSQSCLTEQVIYNPHCCHQLQSANFLKNSHPPL